MRVQFLALGCLLPLLALAGQDQLKYMDYQVTRAQAEAAGAKLAVAGRELDAYLASDAAKRFDSDASESSGTLPPEVNAIFARAGIDAEMVGDLLESTDASSISLSGYAVFKICDSENSKLLQLRKDWAARLFELVLLTRTEADKEQYSQVALAGSGGELLPVVQAYLDSWLAIAAVKVGCTQQAVRYSDFALADSTNEFADGILGMTRSGLMLNAAKNSEAQIDIALDARAKAMAQFLRGGDKLATFAVAAELVATKEEAASDYLSDFEDYDAEFKRAISNLQSPVWRVKTDVLAKVINTRRNICGTGKWMAALVASFLAPEWPTALAVLHAKRQDQVVAAYELADLFDTKSQLSGFNNHLSEIENAPDGKVLIWQAYGKEQTQAELQRAADAITLSAPENGLAIVKLFGHEFLLASGEHNSQEPSQATRWYTLAEIQANFRDSYAFKALTDK